MKSASNKQTVRRFVQDGFVAANAVVLREVLHPDYIDHMPFPGQKPGREGYIEKANYIKSVLPDLTIDIEVMTVDGDLVSEVWTGRATHTGADFLGAKASGRRLEFCGIDVFRVANGQITEIWHVEDFYSALVQTGCLTLPTAAEEISSSSNIRSPKQPASPKRPLPPAGKGIPTLSGLEHVGLTVPNLEEAITFFCDVIGCEFLYKHGPYIDENEGDKNFYNFFVELHPRTEATIAMLRCGNGSNLELFEFKAPGQKTTIPPFSDHGGAHLTFYVDDMERAVSYLRKKGVHVMGGAAESPGPEAGKLSTNTHFKTPWGQMLEVIAYPYGRDYEKVTDSRLFVPNKPDSWYDYG